MEGRRSGTRNAEMEKVDERSVCIGILVIEVQKKKNVKVILVSYGPVSIFLDDSPFRSTQAIAN